MKETDYDSILKTTGGFGRYQILVTIVYSLNMWALACSQMFMVFGGIYPEDVPCSTSQFNSTNHSKLHCGDETMFYSIISQWDLTSDLKIISTIIITIQMSGIMVGPFLFGYLSDRFGRHRILLISELLFIAIGIAKAFSVNWKMYAGLVFFDGCLSGSLMSVNYIYFIEHCPTSKRMIYAITGWAPGCIVLGMLAYLTKHWQTLILSSTAMALPALLITLCLRETPKWLMAEHRFDVARKTLTFIANVNGKKHLNLDELLDELGNLNEPNKPTRVYNYTDLFHNRKITKANIAIISTWINLILIYNGVTFGMQRLYGNIFINFIITHLLAYVPIVMLPLMDAKLPQIGRRHVVLAGLLLETLCLLYVMAAKLTDLHRLYPVSVVTIAILGLMTNSAVQVPAELVIAEFYPTELRTMGHTMNLSLAKLSSMVVPQILHLHFVWRPAPFLIFLVSCTLNMIVAYFFFPETKNQTLPDMVEDTRLDEI